MPAASVLPSPKGKGRSLSPIRKKKQLGRGASSNQEEQEALRPPRVDTQPSVLGGGVSRRGMSPLASSAVMPTSPLNAEGDANNAVLSNRAEGGVAVKLVHAAAVRGDKEGLMAALRKAPDSVHTKDAMGRTPLLLAARGGHYGMVKLLLSWGANVASRDAGHMTVLHHAARHGHADVLGLFLGKKGGIVDAALEDGQGMTALHHAAVGGSAECVGLLLGGARLLQPQQQKGAVNARSAGQMTPLLLAAALGHVEVVECLVRHGAALDAVQSQGMTALHLAAAGGHVEVCHRLLQAGAKADMQNCRKQRPLLLASLEGRDGVVSLLSSAGGAQVDARDEYGLTALLGGALMGHAHVVKVLLREAKANPNEQDSNLDTGLHLAAQEGHLEVAACLLQHGADTEVRNANGDTPLLCAAAHGHLPLVQLLVGLGRAVRGATDLHGRSPVYRACVHDKAEVVAFLAGTGEVDVNVVDDSGCSVLHDACSRGATDMVHILLQAGADARCKSRTGHSTCLHAAALRGHVEVVAELLRHRVDVEAKDGSGNTPLYLAAREGHVAVVALLVGDGRACISSANELDRSPVFAAAMGPAETSVAVLEELLRHDPHADLNAQDKHGYTVLHVAVERGNLAMVEHLVHRRVDVGIRDQLDGWTPLHLACNLHHHQDADQVAGIAAALLSRGADPNARDLQQRTPLHMSSFWGMVPVMAALFEGGNNRHGNMTQSVDTSAKDRKSVDINAKDRKGSTALILASQRGREAAVELLLRQRGAGTLELNAKEAETGMSALHYAARNGHAAAARALVGRGADVAIAEGAGRTPLALAREAGHRPLADWLAEQMKASGQALPPPDVPTRPLHQAVASDVAASVDSVLDSGAAMVQDRDARMRTGLHLAALLGTEQAAGALLRHGADMTARDLDGATPALVAARAGNAGVLGAMLRVRPGDGPWKQRLLDAQDLHQCIQAAARNGHAEVVRLILRHAEGEGGAQALAGLLRRDHPGGSLYETALDNGQEAVMRAVEEVEGGGHAGERGGV